MTSTMDKKEITESGWKTKVDPSNLESLVKANVQTLEQIKAMYIKSRMELLRIKDER